MKTKTKSNSYLFFLLLLIISFQSSGQSNCNPSINITHLPSSLCSGRTPSFTATAFNAGNNPIYKWKKNGVVAGTNSPNYSTFLSVNDQVVCELSTTGCSNNTTVVSNRFLFEPIDNLTPEVTTVASQQIICAGTTVVFTATNKSGNTNMSYQWFVNGNSIAGTNSTIFSTNISIDSTVVQCMMTVPQCPNSGGSTKDYSDPIVIRIPPLLKPGVVITTATTVVCKGSPVNFSAIAVQAGNNPAYEWKINNITASATGPSFITSVLTDGDMVSCRLNIDPSSNCNTPASATSNIIAMKIKELLSPSIIITASKEEICSGSPVVFTASVAEGGINPSYQWQLNGINAGTNSLMYSNSLLGNRDNISFVVTTSSGCNNASATSNVITMVVNETPVITISTDSLTIWAGEQAQLQCFVSGDLASYSWTPASKLTDPFSLMPMTTPLMTNITYQVTVVSTKSCIASKEVQVKVLHKLYIPNSFTPNKDGINDVFRIPPGVPLELKDFSIYDRWGNRVFFSNDVNLGWDGIYKGSNAITGAYIYLIRGRYENQEIILKGHAILIR